MKGGKELATFYHTIPSPQPLCHHYHYNLCHFSHYYHSSKAVKLSSLSLSLSLSYTYTITALNGFPKSCPIYSSVRGDGRGHGRGRGGEGGA